MPNGKGLAQQIATGIELSSSAGPPALRIRFEFFEELFQVLSSFAQGCYVSGEMQQDFDRWPFGRDPFDFAGRNACCIQGIDEAAAIE